MDFIKKHLTNKNISISNLYNIAKGKFSQDTIAKFIKSFPQDKLEQLAKNIKLTPDMVDKIKKIAPQIKLDDPNDREKLKYIANKSGMSQYDIDEIDLMVGTKATGKDLKIRDIQKILMNDDIDDTNNEDDNEDDNEKKVKISKIKLPNINNNEITNNLHFINRILKKTEKGYKITQDEQEKYDRTLDELKNIDDNDPDKDEVNKYLNLIKKTHIIGFDIKNSSISGNYTIIEFARYAHLFRFCLIVIITICIFIYIIIVIISIINVIYLIIKIINSIISLFYNTIITNDQTLSYSAKQIIKSSKNNYKYDIFNIIAEQQTALTIFNTIIYIIYILMAYVILYLLCVIYVQMMRYTHTLNGSISDIDPKYQILSIIFIFFLFSIIHLLIYKFLFKKIAISNFKTITNFEDNIDKQIISIIDKSNNNNDECNKFFNLLTDTSKRNEIDTLFSIKVKNIKKDVDNNIRKYLMMYNIYMYFENYLYMNDIMKEKIKRYFGISSNNEEIEPITETPDITFIGLLDSNERKLLKAYHEDLPFHSLISKDYLEDYQDINEQIGTTIATINKNIIKYQGTFFPFLITCIYILIICFYNVYTLYIIFKFINNTENDNIFMPFIYTLSHRYITLYDRIYSLFFNK
jgi:hypothetical protein